MEKRRIAFFDFDGTLIRHDSLFVFARQTRGRFRLALALLQSAPTILAWKLGLRTNGQAKQRLFSALYKGVPLAVFEQWGRQFSEYIDSDFNPAVRPFVDRHRRNGDEMYIVSASMEQWIRPWASAHGFTGVIATRPEVGDDGHLTGRFATPNCHGPEKVVRIKERIPDIDSCETWAYGDSAGDTAMFEFSDHHQLITH